MVLARWAKRHHDRAAMATVRTDARATNTDGSPIRSSILESFRSSVRGKTRIALAWVFAIALAMSATDSPAWPGAWVCLLGAALRVWASGYLRKDSGLAVGGPYAWVRNPLYLGSFIMAAGAAWSSQSLWLTVAISLVFWVVHYVIVVDEEAKLRVIFGKPYLTYTLGVPRFFPRPWRTSPELLKAVNPNPDCQRFSAELAMKNRAWEAFVTFLSLMALIQLGSMIRNLI